MATERNVNVVQAIRVLNEQLGTMGEEPLAGRADEVIALVQQQQQLLDAYIQSTGPTQIDHGLIRDVMNGNRCLLSKTRRAHTDAAQELQALARGRSAVSAYGTTLSSEVHH